jgi:hypothetical protein
MFYFSPLIYASTGIKHAGCDSPGNTLNSTLPGNRRKKMIILWIRKSKADVQKVNDKKERYSFREHDDIMKKFRLSHPDLNVLDSEDIVTADGNYLAPIYDVKLTANVQN